MIPRSIISADEVASVRALAAHVLRHASAFEWSLQGLGMLRLHMGDNTRLHVWDLRYAAPGASPIHDHLQWALHSMVLSGRITNYRYIEDPAGEPFNYVTLKAGYGCHFKDEPRVTRLLRGPAEVYRPGEAYVQRPDEIHYTVPENGTVTLMRKAPTPDGESARVFWQAGTEWGSAEPRAATQEEVQAITRYALSRMPVAA